MRENDSYISVPMTLTFDFYTSNCSASYH